MNDAINKEEVQQILSVLGTEGVLDTLLCVRRLGWGTASEVAEDMGSHVATAVKRLSGLYDIGILERRVRKGRTRSAQEYSLKTSSFGLDIDLDELAGSKSETAGDAGAYVLLLRDMARRFAKFSRRSVDEIVSSWNADTLDDKPDADEVIQLIEAILEQEVEEYGELTVKSLAAASLDAMGGHDMKNLPSRFFGVG